MNINHAAAGSGTSTKVAVTTAAAVLLGGLKDRKNITIQNLGPNPIYVGFTSGVTTATGTQVPTGQSISLDVTDHIPTYAIAATADQVSPADTRLIEVK